MKYFKLWPVLLCLLLLSGCRQAPAAQQSTQPEQIHTEPATKPPVDLPVQRPTAPPVQPPAQMPTQPPTDLPVELPTAPPFQWPAEQTHSPLYIPDLEVEDVLRYFEEVCLDAEVNNNGNPQLVQKWTQPILYMLNGSWTQEDLLVLERFTDWLNGVEGFPGISQTQDADQANLNIYFCSQEELLELMGEEFSNTDGAVTYWYRDNIINEAIICCRTDLDQTLRNSVILEELYNGLGPIQDTELRPDSIIYQEFSQPQWLSETDQLILQLLYHPALRCGMDREACEVVIRQLYY